MYIFFTTEAFFYNFDLVCYPLGIYDGGMLLGSNFEISITLSNRYETIRSIFYIRLMTIIVATMPSG